MINLKDIKKLKLFTNDYVVRGEGDNREVIKDTHYDSITLLDGKSDEEKRRDIENALRLAPLQWQDGWANDTTEVPTSIMNFMIFVNGKLVSYRDLPIGNKIMTMFDNLPRFDYSEFAYTPSTLSK